MCAAIIQSHFGSIFEGLLGRILVSAIMVSALDIAKRAYVKLLLQLATIYGVVLTLTRDSPAAAVASAFRKVAVKVHPDKGGTVDHQQALNAAREKWE